MIDAMIDMMHAEQKVDVFGFVSRIREQRSQLVQTEASGRFPPCLACQTGDSDSLLVFVPQMQYSFIYQALLEYYLYGDTELDVSSLEGHLHKLHNTFVDGDRVGLEEEFKVQKEEQILPGKAPIESLSSAPPFLNPFPDPFVCGCFVPTQKLTNMRIMKENMRTGNLPANMKKNRVLQIIPCKKEAAV